LAGAATTPAPAMTSRSTTKADSLSRPRGVQRAVNVPWLSTRSSPAPAASFI